MLKLNHIQALLCMLWFSVLKSFEVYYNTTSVNVEAITLKICLRLLTRTKGMCTNVHNVHFTLKKQIEKNKFGNINQTCFIMLLYVYCWALSKISILFQRDIFEIFLHHEISTSFSLVNDTHFFNSMVKVVQHLSIHTLAYIQTIKNIGKTEREK